MFHEEAYRKIIYQTQGTVWHSIYAFNFSTWETEAVDL